ncbi:MAG: alpha/beta fold hydrolase [Pseudonocardiales bacterium]|nr:alpha/beta fold hydrolase [Pseudonocardiales bacterium]
MSLGRLLAELRILAESAPVPATAHQWGSHPEQWGDLRVPRNVGRPPVAVLFHGGFWRQQFDRSIMDAVAVDLVRRGWATWNVEYRRADCGGGVPQTWEDAVAAVQFLTSVDAPLDRARIVTVGHSAGGHLALWCASSVPVTAAVSLAGVCDLTLAAVARLGNDAVTRFIGCAPSQCPADYAAVDLVCRLPTAVPQLLVHGRVDDVVPIEQPALRRTGA